MRRVLTVVTVLAAAAALTSAATGVATAGSLVRPAVTTQLQKVQGVISAGQSLDLTASCPAGTAPTAGGVDAPGARMLWSTPRFLHDGPAGWQAAEINPTGLAVRMTVTAVCTGGLTDVANGSQALIVQPGDGTGSTAGCPRDLPLLGGGLLVYDGQTAHTVSASDPVTASYLTPGWSAAVHDDDAMPLHGLSQSVCGSGVRNLGIEYGAWVNLPEGQSGVATVTCPGGQHLIGAGFDSAFKTVTVDQAHPDDLSTYEVAAQSDRRSDAFRALALCGN